jgi:hypothetical protein
MVLVLSSLALAAPAAADDPGALVRMRMSARVGVLLDEIPPGALREAAASEALSADAAEWTARAERQVKLTYYRLVFRGLYYPADWSANPHAKGPLPLPPKSVWHVALSSPARRARVDGHDLVVRDYTFETYLVSDVDSPGKTEPRLGTVGGTWDESFSLPADPELLLERTGYACMDEDEYPPRSVFEENTSYFYDDTCHVASPAASSCHITAFPKESCVEALKRRVGRVKATMSFTRVPYDASVADAHRVGAITNSDGADLTVVDDGLESERRVFYRFFEPGSCDLEEGTIAKLGWRRLVAFSAIVRNDGTERIHVGDVTDPSSPWVQSHVFEFSPCHHHYHFSFYGNFDYAGAPGSKRAFCLEDTNRFHNDELTPLTAEHQSCAFQGIGHGWGDEYEFGIPGQWVDITDVDASTPHDLTFRLNPEHFLCEGKPVLDGSGNLIFDPTAFTDPQGNTISRLRCNLFGAWDANNLGSVSFTQSSGSFVTEP